MLQMSVCDVGRKPQFLTAYSDAVADTAGDCCLIANADHLLTHFDKIQPHVQS